MKHKINILLGIGLLSLGACSRPLSRDPLDIKVATPSGAPAIAFANYINDPNLEVNGASEVLGYLSDASDKDIVVAPTNALVAKVMKAGAPFKIAATVTFGNLYVLSLGNDDDNVLDSSDYVIAFQQNQLPDKVFKYVYSDLDLNVTYADNLSVAESYALVGKDNNNKPIDYILLAEPSVTKVLAKNNKAAIYSDIQELYKNKAGVNYFTQASIFVRNSLTKEKVEEFLTQIEKDIKDILKNPKSILNLKMEDELYQSKFLCDKSYIVDVLTTNKETNRNPIGLGFVRAYQNKDSIDSFLKNLGFLPGDSTTSEENYYF